jgi:hypothetical protein
MDLVVPQYGLGSLADVVPSLLAGLDVPGMENVLGLTPTSRVCILLIDGLGWHLLREYGSEATFLTSLMASSNPITAGFPATTVTSIAALAAGMPAGEHGLVGYSFAAGPGEGELLDALRWQRHGVAKRVDLRSVLVPEEVQPRRTAFERAADAGVAVRLVVPREQEGSGLSRAVLRGGHFRAVHALGDLVSRTLETLHERDRLICYTYHADLDAIGHIYGPGSDPWRWQLAFVDRLAAAIAENLPRGGTLLVTADHGMVTTDVPNRIDFDTDATLQDGVLMLGGEARVRHVYTIAGAEDDVRARWTEALAHQAWILSRDEAIAAGWFGPRVAEHVRPRIGDLVVAASGSLAIVRSKAEPLLSKFVGHHGSLTADEQLVPLLVTTNTSES